MSLMVEATEGKPQLSAGTHTLKCISIENDEIESLREPAVWRFTFVCEDEFDPNGNPIEIDGIASRYLSPLSKAWGWCEALGMKLEVGKRHDLEGAVGGVALGKVIHKASANGAKYARLDELIPLPKGAAPTPTPGDNDVPFDAEPPAESSPLNDWLTAMRGVGFSTKEIIDLCKSRFEKLPRELSDLQRDLLGKEYGI